MKIIFCFFFLPLSALWHNKHGWVFGTRSMLFVGKAKSKINHKSNAPKFRINSRKYTRWNSAHTHTHLSTSYSTRKRWSEGELPRIVIHQMRFQMPATIISSILFLNQINVLLLDLFLLLLMCFYYVHVGRKEGKREREWGKHACQCSRSFYGGLRSHSLPIRRSQAEP